MDNESHVQILHVDDNSAFTSLVVDMLENEDERFNVETTLSASEGLDRLSESDIDCIVSDYNMPGMDGIEFLKTVREEYPKIPFILFTGKGSEAVASEAISTGVTDYLQKPGGTEQYELLANRIRNAVELTQARRERQRNLDAIETAREGIALFDDDGKLVYVNEAFADIYGYDSEEMIGEHWELIYRKKDYSLVHEEILPTIEEKGHWRGETMGVRADGTTFLEDHRLVSTDGGDLVCTVQDISERKEREQELQQKSARLEVLFENSPDMINIHDSDGNIIDPNSQLCEETGYSPEELTDMKVWNLDQTMDPDSAHILWENMEVGERHQLEGRYQRRDGSTFPVEVHIRCIHLDSQNQFVVIARDITKRKESKHRLSEERAFIRQSLNALDDVFYVFDPDREIVRWNARLSELTGYADEEIAEMEPTDFFPNDHAPRIADAVEEIFETGRTTVQADYLTKSGERIPHELTGVRLTDSEGDVLGFAGVGRDLRDRREYERQLEQRNKRLEEFASIISHDLRNPLNVAQGRLDLAQDDCDSKHLDAVGDAQSRIQQLIEELLTLAREGEIALNPEAVSLPDLAQESWQGVMTEDAVLSIEEEATVWADESSLRQIFENLFRNAIEHSGQNVTVRVGLLDEEDGFYVADDGPGIPAIERTTVFKSGVTTSEDGIGAGLSIVMRVADAHDWDVRVTESSDGGARFEITEVRFDAE